MLKVNRLRQQYLNQISSPTLVAQAASLIVIAVGGGIILGWLFDLEFLHSPIMIETTKANTAVCFILSGIVLWIATTVRGSGGSGGADKNLTVFSCFGVSVSWDKIATLCALSVYIMGWLTLSQYLFNWNLGIDELLFSDLPKPLMTFYPGRMGINTALNFILIGRALELLIKPKTSRSYWYTQILTLIALVISGLAVMGYAYKVEILYRILPQTTPMALHTAVTFIVLGVGILWARIDQGFMRVVMNDTYAGLLTRRLLAVTIVVPFLLGWLILKGQQAGLYEPALALSLLMAVLIIALCVLIWHNAALVEGVSTERDRVKLALREKEEKLNSFVDANVIGILFGDIKGGIQQANDEFLRMIGYTREELVAGKIDWVELTPTEYLLLDEKGIAEAKANGACTPYEKEYIRKDGSRIPILIGYTLLGELREESVAFILDLSDRKRADIALRQSEERLRLAVDNIPDIFAIYDEKLRFQFLNAEALKRFQTKLEDIIGNTDEETFPPHVTQTYLDTLRTAKETRTAQTTEATFTSVYGRITALIKYVPILDDKGEIYQILGFAEDITTRKLAEETSINQQKWLEDLLNLMPTPLLLIEPHSARVTFANRAADAVAGGKFPKAESIADYDKFYHSTDAAGNIIPNEQAPGVRVARGERIEGYELDWHTPTGMRSLLMFADTLPAMHGHSATCVLVFQDITNLKQVEKALSLGYKRLHLLFNTANDLLSSQQPVALIDSLFKKLSEQIGLDVYFNYLVVERTLQLTSYSGIAEEIAKEIDVLKIGQAVCGTAAEERRPIALENILESTDPKTDFIRSVGITAYYAYPLISQEQLLGTISFGSRTRVKFSQNEIGMMQAVCDQIAIAMERARLIASLQQQTEQLKEANRMKDEFLAILSHELRSPLNAILGWAQLLRSRKLDEKKTEQAIETIERNAKAQTQLIGDLLDISRMIRGKLRLNIRNCDLVPVMEAAIQTVRLAAEAKKIDVKFSTLPAVADSQNPNFLVSGDSERLQQVIWNLLSNAIKFTPTGGSVEMHLSVVAKYAQITVTDTGIGIGAEFLPYVFDRFRQADSSSTRFHGGLGLGLAIVRHLVELHGGSVCVESSGVGKGAIFTVKLPLVQACDRPGDLLSKGENNATQPILSGVKVLVVDDEADSREYLTTVLQQCQAQVKAVASAREALDTLQKWKPDVLVSDIAMPEEDGYFLIREVRLRENAATQERKIPAAALTAYARAEDRTRALQAGFQMHLPKPIEPNELATVVACLAGKLHSSDQ